MASTTKSYVIAEGAPGVGMEVAKSLLEKGNEVVLATNSEAESKAAIEEIKKTNPDAKITAMQLDVADPKSIDNFMHEFEKLDKDFEGIINFPATSQPSIEAQKKIEETKEVAVPSKTKEGFEKTIAENFVGPYNMVNRMLESMKKREERTGRKGNRVRVINVASRLHDPEATKSASFEIKDMSYEKDAKRYSPLQAWKDAQAARVMWTNELARRNQDIMANAICPGWMPSLSRSFFGERYPTAMSLFPKDDIFNARDSVMNLLRDDFSDSGRFFREFEEFTPSIEAMNRDIQRDLFDMTSTFFPSITASTVPKSTESAAEEPMQTEKQAQRGN